MRVFTEPFEHGDALFFDYSEGAVSTTQKRSGNYSYRLQNIAQAQKNIAALSEGYFRFGWRTDGTNNTTGKVLIWRNGTTEIGSIRWDPTVNKLKLYTGGSTLVGTGVIPFNFSTNYLVELYFKIADSGGRLSVKIDGVLDTGLDFTGDTKPSTQTSVDNLVLNGHVGSTSSTYYDDLALNDTTGAADNSWVGDTSFVRIAVTGPGNVTQLVASAGANWECLDEVPPDGDTTYVEGTTLGTYDLYTVSLGALAGTTIKRLWIEGRGRDTVAAGGKIKFVLLAGGTLYKSADLSLLTTYTIQLLSSPWLTNPATGSPWSSSDTIQIGWEVTG